MFGPQPAAGGRSDLAATVADLFRQAGLAPRDLSKILLDVGPGSYTGLRVAVTWARFCRQYLGAELCTVTSLELMVVAAWRAEVIDQDRPTRAVLDARRKRFHHALVGRSRTPGARAELLEPPRATPLEELIASLDPDQQVLSDVDLGARWPTVRPRGHDAALLFDPLLAPRTAGEELEPLYLMGSYADRSGGS